MKDIISFHIVNMGQEAFNDALKNIAEANDYYSKNQYYGMWSASRAAMNNMCLSAESDLSKLIAISLKRKGEESFTSEQNEIYKNLTDPTKENELAPESLKSIRSKYKQLLKANDDRGWRRASLPAGYQDATRLRNKITHYSFSKSRTVYSKTIVEDIERSMREVKSFIKHIWSVANEGYPHWVDQTEYISLDKEEGVQEDSLISKTRSVRRVRSI